MSQNDGNEKSTAENISRIIEALENPDNPKRMKAMITNEAKAEKWRMFERYGVILSNLIFIALAMFLLGNMRMGNSAGGNYWMGIVVGAGVGLALVLVSKMSLVFNVKPARPAAIVVSAILIMAAVFIADEIRKRITLSTREVISVATISFLLTLSTYNLTVNLLSLRKGNSSKGSME